MLDDIEDHDSPPNADEGAWRGLQPLGVIARTVALAAIALVVAWSTSVTLEESANAPVAMYGPR